MIPRSRKASGKRLGNALKAAIADLRTYYGDLGRVLHALPALISWLITGRS